MHLHHHPHHDHGPGDSSSSRKIGWAFFINLVFAIFELVGGFLAGSVAVMSDALHDFGDSIALGLAYVFEKKATGGANDRFSYGYRRLSLLSALVTSGVLIGGSLLILVHAIPLLWNPKVPDTDIMIGLAIFGVAVNGYMAHRLSKGQKLNEKALSLHLLEDVLGWVLVLVVAIVMKIYPLPILDPILSIAFTLFILWHVWQNLSQTMHLFLQGVPGNIDFHKMTSEIETLPKVVSTHDLHAWSLDGENHVLTIHVVVEDQTELTSLSQLKDQIHAVVNSSGRFHTTIEFEHESDDCEKVDCTPTMQGR